jgi:hypothetical protein
VKSLRPFPISRDKLRLKNDWQQKPENQMGYEIAIKNENENWLIMAILRTAIKIRGNMTLNLKECLNWELANNKRSRELTAVAGN